MNYKIQKTKNRFQIVESTTGHCIRTCSDIHKAQIDKTHFNTGGGFDGWTPAFILQTANISTENIKN